MNLDISALEYARQVRDGAISAEDFVAATLERIGDVDGRLHAFLSVSEDALDRAREVDRRVRKGTAGACMGMPVSVKDNICVSGSKTTCASRMLEDYVSPYDATAVSRLASEDAVIIGKTNMDEFAMGLTTEFSAFGPSRNPWNDECVPGGSSGGSAVSVSALECVASLGSDTGGSVRNPASFCGTVGYKPTYGLISRYGLISYANSIEQIGPLTRTVSDAAFVMNIVSGRDPADDTTVDAAGGGYLEGIDDGIEGARVGIIKEMASEGSDPAVLSALSDAASRLEGLGASCGEASLGTLKYSVAAYYTITATEAGSNLARYDNLRYGYDLPPGGYEFGAYVRKARSRFGPEVKRRMILGGFVPSAGHAGKYFLKAVRIKQRLAAEVDAAFKEYDLLLSPTVPVLPFRLGERIDDPVSLFLVDANTVTANLAGKPAVSVPFAVAGGLPVGMQLMADSMQDRFLLRAARALERTVDLPGAPT